MTQETAVDVILVCSDLMLTSSVSSLAGSLGRVLRTARSTEQVADLIRLSDGQPLVFVDLATTGINLPELISVIPSDCLARAVAYGPHVHEALLEGARQAGFGRVMSRGQFNSQYPALLTAAVKK